MNQWKVIWNAYHVNSTIRKLFKNVINRSTRREKAILFIFTCVFLAGVVMLFISSKISFWLVILGEGVLLYQMEHLRKGLILNEYGDISQLQTPHDDIAHQTTRYLMFKQTLKDNSVTKNHVQDCQELIDLQINIASSEGLLRKSFSSFVSGILIGLLASFWKKLEMADFIDTAVTLIAIFALVYFVLYLIPSKLEKLKEMKYFMLLYNREF